VDTGWASARTFRIVANNLFGRQCSDMSPTSTARTRNREQVSAGKSCIEFDLCDTAASAIIQSRAHKLLANSSAAMFLSDQHHADPSQAIDPLKNSLLGAAMEQEGIAILADREIGHCPTSTCVVLGEF
jgi:hypothetical protein